MAGMGKIFTNVIGIKATALKAVKELMAEADESAIRYAFTFLSPNLQVQYTPHKGFIFTEAIQKEWVKHLAKNGGYIYLHEVAMAQKCIDLLPRLGLAYRHTAMHMAKQKREILEAMRKGEKISFRRSDFWVTDAETTSAMFESHATDLILATAVGNPDDGHLPASNPIISCEYANNRL